MGIATLLIIVCHAHAFGVEMSAPIKIILGNGGVGVDLFLFLSGLGMYNSYYKVKRGDIKLYAWYYRRWMRIVVPCFVLVFPLIIASSFIRDVSWLGFVSEVSGFGFIVRKGALWFLSCILMLYLFTPLLDCFLRKKEWLFPLLLIIVCLTIAYIRILPSNLTFCIQRWPSYIIGYYVAGRIRENGQGNLFLFVFFPLLAYAVCFLANHTIGTHFSLFWMQGIAVVSLAACVLNAVQCGTVNNVLALVGGVSLESYITNEYLLRYLQGLFDFLDVVPISNLVFYIGGTVICLIVSFFANRLCARLV